MHSDEERRLAHMGQIVLHFFPMILRVILTEVNEINQYACRSIQNNRDFKSKLFEDETSIVLTMINNGYSFFNIQLCYKMLRHFEWINPPRKGWGNEIEDADIELADDIERIRQISNTVILMPLHDVSEIIYSSVIQKVKEISVRIARFKKESNKSEDSIYSCEIGNKDTLEEDEISTLLNNLRKMHKIKNNPFPCNPVTKGLNRYARLGLLIVNVFPNMYREIVSSNISAKMLYRQIQKNLKQNPRKFDKLTHDERTGLNLLKNGSYGEIDFTTIYKLIRAFAIVDDPNQGWAKTPSASDTEIADDIERMRIIRNKIVHKIKAEVSKVEMNDLFTEITSIASRVDKYLGKQPGAGFEIEVSKYRTCPLDHHLEQKYTQALQEIENMKEQFTFEEVHFYYGNSFQTFVENVKQKLGKPGKKQIVIVLEDIDGDEEKINQLNKMKKELSSSSSLIKFEGAYKGSLVMNILINENVLITENQLGSALHSFLKQVFHAIDEEFSLERVIQATLVAMNEKLDLEMVVEDDGWDTCFSETPEISNSLCLDIRVKDEFFETDLRMQRELQGFAQSLRRSNGSLKKTAVSAILSSRDSDLDMDHENLIKKEALEKMYVCVTGLDTHNSSEMVFQYFDEVSKQEIILNECVRDVGNPEHAIIVFKNSIDIDTFTKALEPKYMKSDSLIFDVITPPVRLIISSFQNNVTEAMVKDYLVARKKKYSRLHTTDEGLVSVKFTNNEDAVELLESQNIKIGGSDVFISTMYYCMHGALWNHSIHKVRMPAPFKITFDDKYRKSYIADIVTKCNEYLKQHHALFKCDEMCIECTLKEESKNVRKYIHNWTETIETVWKAFCRNNVLKKELQIAPEAKATIVASVNDTFDSKSKELKVIFSEDDCTAIVLVGPSETVEKYYNSLLAMNLKTVGDLERQRKVHATSMKLQSIEIALMLKELRFDQLKSDIPDIKFEVNGETGTITFSGTEQDITNAKLKLFEVQNNYTSFTVPDLSKGQIVLLSNDVVKSLLYERFQAQNIQAVVNTKNGQLSVCSWHENITEVKTLIKGIVNDELIELCEQDRYGFRTDWEKQKKYIINVYDSVVYIDDSIKGKIRVTATNDILDTVIRLIRKYLESYAITEERLTIEDTKKVNFLQVHCKDLMIEIKKKYCLQIEFSRKAVLLRGTKKAIANASFELTDGKNKFFESRHVLSAPIKTIKILFPNHCSITLPITITSVENATKTVISVDRDNLRQMYENTRRESFTTGQQTSYRSESVVREIKRKLKSLESQKSTTVHAVSVNEDSRKPKLANKKDIVCKHGTRIVLVNDTLGAQKADVVVCSFDPMLDSFGGSAKSIELVEGVQFFDEVNAQRQSLRYGEVAAAKCKRMQCKEVYFTSIPKYNRENEKILRRCIVECLNKASNSKYVSIVFCALGTGNLGYPRDAVAKILYNCVKGFDECNTSVKDVRFLCYMHDTKTVQAFEIEEMKQRREYYRHTGDSTLFHEVDDLPVFKIEDETEKQQILASPDRGKENRRLITSHIDYQTDEVTRSELSEMKHEQERSPRCYKKESITVNLIKGDLGTQQIDVLVASVRKDLDLKRSGETGKSLYLGLGQEKIQKDITSQYPNGVDIRGFVGAQLTFPVGKCKAVYLTSLDSWKEQKCYKDSNKIEADPKSQLNEKLQKRHIRNIKYKEISRTGPDHALTFTVQLFINDTPCAIGTGNTIQNADRSAARQTLKQFDEGSLSFSDNLDQQICNFVYSCLLMANEDGYTSIGFPAIGAGALEYPVDVVAKYMYDTVNTFAKNRPNCIMSVNLVLYDEETFNVYRNEHMKRLLTAELISLEKNIEKAKLEQKKSDDKGSWPLTFTIYGFSLRDIYNAKKGLNRVIEGQNKTEEHHDRLMSVTADKEVIMDTEFSTIIKSHEDDYRRESDGAAVAFKDYQRDVNDGLQKEKTAYLKKDKEDKLEVLTKEKSPGDRGISKWPQEWEDQGTRNLKAFRLLNSSLEYKTVENKFIESVFSGRPEWSAQFNKQTFKVTKIERVQNVSLYDMYKMEKALLEEQNPECTKNELELWHGTPNKTVNMINSYGFKQFHKATKELKWDEGVFFTADASHAAMKGLRTGYAADEQCIYMCKVLTGVHCKWVIGMLELPFRQDGTILKFNSAKDDKYDPVAEYIIFNFKQAYPQYCIKFKY